jgi:GNAT superfamily N-acetyltransferase
MAFMIETKIQVSTFRPQLINAFKDLNLEWIEKHFVVEPTDLDQLSDPLQRIIHMGGEIFFLFENNTVVGTCAMVPHGESEFELAKMAVSPDMRGKGYGDLLMTTAIDWARNNKAGKIILLSNTVLEPAIRLYRKHGFQVVHLGAHPDYERCNIVMKLEL